jgi:hypothetical protein
MQGIERAAVVWLPLTIDNTADPVKSALPQGQLFLKKMVNFLFIVYLQLGEY